MKGAKLSWESEISARTRVITGLRVAPGREDRQREEPLEDDEFLLLLLLRSFPTIPHGRSFEDAHEPWRT